MSELTREMILAMPAGREIDALVAERVMGWTLRRDGIYVSNPKDDSLFGTLWGINSDAPYLFEPSENIDAAWQVVEKFAHSARNKLARQQGWSHFALIAYPDEGWICRLGPDGKECGEGYADTAPLAICRAALIAVMGGNIERSEG